MLATTLTEVRSLLPIPCWQEIYILSEVRDTIHIEYLNSTSIIEENMKQVKFDNKNTQRAKDQERKCETFHI